MMELREKVSFATLQSDSRGKFGELWEGVLESKEFGKYAREFSELDSPELRVDYVQRNFLSCIQLRPIYRYEPYFSMKIHVRNCLISQEKRRDRGRKMQTRRK